MHSVGFEPTSTNTFELESNPLDRSGTNAGVFSKLPTIYTHTHIHHTDTTHIHYSLFILNFHLIITLHTNCFIRNPHITNENIYSHPLFQIYYLFIFTYQQLYCQRVILHQSSTMVYTYSHIALTLH